MPTTPGAGVSPPLLFWGSKDLQREQTSLLPAGGRLLSNSGSATGGLGLFGPSLLLLEPHFPYL